MSKLFFIDDEPILLKLCELFLSKVEGLEVLFFENAEDALRELQSNKLPDLIITDIKMPNMSGFDLAEKLIAEGIMTHLKFCYCSSFASLQDASDIYGLKKKNLLNFPFYNKPIGKDIISFIETQLNS